MVERQHNSTWGSCQLSRGRAATLACLLEASAPKPGNVRAGAAFDDMSFADFVTSAHAIGPAMEAAPEAGIGMTVLRAIQATRAITSANTNLGTVLLLAPIAAGSTGPPLPAGTRMALRNMTPADAASVFAAIRLVRPGGLGTVHQYDVRDTAPESLLDAMHAAADRDLVARQYATGFVDLFVTVLPLLEESSRSFEDFREGIVDAQLRLLARFPDSLISRKCGSDVAREASVRAAEVLQRPPGTQEYAAAINRLDRWLRDDGNRRNPGTTADLIAAGLFAGILTGTINWRSAAVPAGGSCGN